jgi:hypothetical protein
MKHGWASLGQVKIHLPIKWALGRALESFYLSTEEQSFTLGLETYSFYVKISSPNITVLLVSNLPVGTQIETRCF